MNASRCVREFDPQTAQAEVAPAPWARLVVAWPYSSALPAPRMPPPRSNGGDQGAFLEAHVLDDGLTDTDETTE
jgi:hypothetical protein